LTIIVITLIRKREELKLTPQTTHSTCLTHTYTNSQSKNTQQATRLLLREISVHYCLYYLPGFLLVHVSALTEI